MLNAFQRTTSRILLRLDALKKRPLDSRKTASDLARELEISKGSLHDLLHSNATQGLLVRLDQIADFLGMTPAELVARKDSELMELSPQERRFIGAVRGLPKPVSAQLLSVLEFFSQADPDAVEQREWLALIRRLNTAGQRSAVRQYVQRVIQQGVAQRRGRESAPGLPHVADGRR